MKTIAKTSPDNAITARVSQALQNRLGPTKYSLWFDNSAKIGINKDTLKVTVPSKFHAEWISRNFKNDLAQVARKTAGQIMDIHVEVKPDIFSNQPVNKNPKPAHEHDRNSYNKRPDITSKYNHNSNQRNNNSNSIKNPDSIPEDRYDLNRYVVGHANILGYRAAMQMTENDPFTGSLFIHGGCGLGKTHLLQGICRQFKKHFTNTKIRYVTGEQFTNEYIYAIRNNKLDSFRKKIRQLDLLAIDDIHFLSNKKATQNEFLCTFDAIGHANARIILASDEHPKQVKQFHQRLVSRFLSGMVVELSIPDSTMRFELITVLAKRRGLKIMQKAVNTLAQHPFSSVREIEGVLTKLQALKSLPDTYINSNNNENESSNDVGMILVKIILNEYSAHQNVPIKISNIIKLVADKFRVDPTRLHSSSRQPQVVMARSVISYLARKLTTHSLPEIARALGKKNHSTILAAIKRVTRDIEADKSVVTVLENNAVSIRYLIDTLTNSLLASA